MTLFKPFLRLNRLQVIYNGNMAYDERFHSGVNIICGENSSGKSTITELIFYVFGGEIDRWKQEALRCDYVIAEIIVNNAVLTLRREISSAKQRPMNIFWGTLEESRNSSLEDWQLFPFRRSENKESFSQVIFRALEMPEVRGEKSSNITMHQIFRLIYSDQITPVNNFFRYEQFDSALHRITIGDLLCGVYSNNLYQMQLELDEKEKEFKAIELQFRNIIKILGEAKQTLNIEDLENQIVTLENKRKELYDELKQLKNRKQEEINDTNLKEIINTITKEISQKKSFLRELLNRKESLEFDIEDSKIFVDELYKRVDALDESRVTKDSLGAINFIYCPACLAPIPDEKEELACYLCKTAIEDSGTNSNLLKIRQEMEFQIAESQSLISSRSKDLAKIMATLPSLQSEIEELNQHYNYLTESAITERDAEGENILKEIGYIDRSIENLHENARLISLVDEIKEKKAELNSQIAKLKDGIDSIKEELGHKKDVAYNQIAVLTGNLLEKDLDREIEFKLANDISFNFGDNTIVVDGKSQFSASSMVYLKNCFHLALFWASGVHGFFNYPRLVMFDNVEDKGMEVERSHNFQRVVNELSDNLEVDHQIIYATSMVVQDYLGTDKIVGEYYTHDNKSLKMGR